MTKSPQPYLTHVRQALDAIATYRPATKDALTPQSMAWDAILMRLHTIGENLAHLRHLDEDAFAAQADPAWYKAIGLWNIIAHGYEQIDPDTLWEVLTVDLPHLAQTLEPKIR